MVDEARWDWNRRVCIKNWYIGLFIILLFCIVIFKVIPDIVGPTFTIQDVWVYCCNNRDVIITKAGDNCTNVINNIYNGKC